jgi:hypothetical protein
MDGLSNTLKMTKKQQKMRGHLKVLEEIVGEPRVSNGEIVRLSIEGFDNELVLITQSMRVRLLKVEHSGIRSVYRPTVDIPYAPTGYCIMKC